jgi:hypothetical protein
VRGVRLPGGRTRSAVRTQRGAGAALLAKRLQQMRTAGRVSSGRDRWTATGSASGPRCCADERCPTSGLVSD